MGHPYADFVSKVARPARYLGGEYQSVAKELDSVQVRTVLAFPDVYEIGMSHLGTKLLYSVLNKDPEVFCERCFTPWTDMEAELRARKLPLVSLETATPLSEFDVVGVSLQYEMTYTNVLTLLDLGGIPIHAADRDDHAPLVLGGGPTATHPEPMAPYFDAFFIGEAEEELLPLLREWKRYRTENVSRREALIRLAEKYPLYVPSLYETKLDVHSGLEVVAGPVDPRVPAKVRRGMVKDINDYPFPSDSPVPYAEAIFDRASIEIARGCTEGCRFCQAGMIYRPVRERDPKSVVESLVGMVDNAGYDEASRDKFVHRRLFVHYAIGENSYGGAAGRKISLSVSSLRAYGLNEELLDELASVRATGLTFAPEAGTQRMRDVVNKNVTEEHIRESAERVFDKGWTRLKLYFMIGLPSEQEEDVRGIVDTGMRMFEIGRERVGGRAQVTVSVSSHVPKPHTPFQWCRMDSKDELSQKQSLLREQVRGYRRRVKLRLHDNGISFVEGVLARGDRRVAKVIEHAWRSGARFDGWDELFSVERWHESMRACAVEPSWYLETIPVDARLPWDHIDVGLAEGFLAWEYRRALKDRLSHPCGKPYKTLLHHTKLSEAVADKRKLVCYDCGVACDLTKMRQERIDYLQKLPVFGPKAPVFVPTREHGRAQPRVRFSQGEGNSYRLRYTKTGRAAFVGHLDTARLLARMFRRANLAVIYSQGFHPKPIFTYGPALPLGAASLGEPFDVRIDTDCDAEVVREHLNEVAPEGIVFSYAEKLAPRTASVSKHIVASDWAFSLAKEIQQQEDFWRSRSLALLERDVIDVQRSKKSLNVRPFLLGFDFVSAKAAEKVCSALGWQGAPLLTCRVSQTPEGSVRPSEITKLLSSLRSLVCSTGFAV